MKHLKMSLLALSIGSAVLLSGCSTSAEEDCCTSAKVEKTLQKNPAVYNKLSREKADRITRELTMSYYDDERRSAAIEEGGFKHTLGINNPLYNSDEYPQNVKYDLSKRYSGQNAGNGNGYKNVPVTAVFKPNKQSSDYSYYELGRWQRLCDGTNGKNMDRLDWRFVRKHQDEFPVDLLDTCRLPSGKLLTQHGISTPAEYRKSDTSKNVQKDNLPATVYPYIMKDHTPANTPIVIKEPTITTDDDIVVTPVPYFDKSKEAKTAKIRPYAKSATDKVQKTDNSKSELEWLEKEIN